MDSISSTQSLAKRVNVVAGGVYRGPCVQGHAMAQTALGSCYDKGAGVDADMAEAARWHLAAAEQGVPQSQYQYGVYCELGQGVPENPSVSRQSPKKTPARRCLPDRPRALVFGSSLSQRRGGAHTRRRPC